MKYLLIVAVLFTFVACSGKTTKNDIEYWKDDRTGICFVSYSYPGFSSYSFTYVPCNLIPKELLK